MVYRHSLPVEVVEGYKGSIDYDSDRQMFDVYIYPENGSCEHDRKIHYIEDIKGKPISLSIGPLKDRLPLGRLEGNYDDVDIFAPDEWQCKPKCLRSLDFVVCQGLVYTGSKYKPDMDNFYLKELDWNCKAVWLDVDEGNISNKDKILNARDVADFDVREDPEDPYCSCKAVGNHYYNFKFSKYVNTREDLFELARDVYSELICSNSSKRLFGDEDPSSDERARLYDEEVGILYGLEKFLEMPKVVDYFETRIKNPVLLVEDVVKEELVVDEFEELGQLYLRFFNVDVNGEKVASNLIKKVDRLFTAKGAKTPVDVVECLIELRSSNYKAFCNLKGGRDDRDDWQVISDYFRYSSACKKVEQILSYYQDKYGVSGVDDAFGELNKLVAEEDLLPAELKSLVRAKIAKVDPVYETLDEYGLRRKLENEAECKVASIPLSQRPEEDVWYDKTMERIDELNVTDESKVWVQVRIVEEQKASGESCMRSKIGTLVDTIALIERDIKKGPMYRADWTRINIGDEIKRREKELVELKARYTQLELDIKEKGKESLFKDTNRKGLKETMLNALTCLNEELVDGTATLGFFDALADVYGEGNLRNILDRHTIDLIERTLLESADIDTAIAKLEGLIVVEDS